MDPGCVEIMPRKRVTLQVRTWLYSEQTDTRYFSDSVTFVTGDLQSTEGSESTHGCTQRRGIPGTSQTAGDLESTEGSQSTHGCTQSRRIPGTSQTASPSSLSTWRVHKGQRVQVLVLGANGDQVTSQTASPSHLRHGRPGEYRGVREYTLLYSEQTDTRYFSDSDTFRHGRPGEYTGVREYTFWYSEQTETRLLLRQRHLLTFVTGDLESTEGSESTHCCTRSRRIPGTSQTATPFVMGDLESTQGSESTRCCTQRRRTPGTSQTKSPSSQATWRVQRDQRVQVETLRADKYRYHVLLGHHHHKVHRVATAAFWRTFSDENKIGPG